MSAIEKPPPKRERPPGQGAPRNQTQENRNQTNKSERPRKRRIYQASHIKRHRSTKAEVEDRRWVELDAIDPDRLRRIVEVGIERHLPKDRLAVLKVAE